MFNRNFREEQRLRREKEREAREKERARARIRREIDSLNREISELESLRELFRRKGSDLNDLNMEWNKNKNTYLRMEMVRDIEVSRKFEGEVAIALKNELPNGLNVMSQNVRAINNVDKGIGDQINNLNKKIERLNSQVADSYRRLSMI